MLTEERVGEVVEVGPERLTSVLLGIFAGRTLLDDSIFLAVNTRHRLAETGETETLKTSLTWWKENLSRLLVHR
jgi:hypothetical protein